MAMIANVGILACAALLVGCGGSSKPSAPASSPVSETDRGMGADAGEPRPADENKDAARAPSAPDSEAVATSKAEPATRPLVVPGTGESAVTGSLSKSEISTEIRRHLSRIRHCYEKQLKHEPSLAGRVDVSFTISATGAVSKATAKGLRPDVEKCVVSAMKAMVFPAPKGGGIVIVRYPFNFELGQ